MLNLYRRHLKDCAHRAKGAAYTKCNCPVWCDGELNGKRIRESLKLRDWHRAIRKLAAMEDPTAPRAQRGGPGMLTFADFPWAFVGSRLNTTA
jgi:hypothetical protein